MQIAIVAFGHVHFKDACAELGVDWRRALHVYQNEQVAGRDDLLLIKHWSAERFNGRIDNIVNRCIITM